LATAWTTALPVFGMETWGLAGGAAGVAAWVPVAGAVAGAAWVLVAESTGAALGALTAAAEGLQAARTREKAIPRASHAGLCISEIKFFMTKFPFHRPSHHSGK
jgi:hypothetical protein